MHFKESTFPSEIKLKCCAKETIFSIHLFMASLSRDNIARSNITELNMILS